MKPLLDCDDVHQEVEVRTVAPIRKKGVYNLCGILEKGDRHAKVHGEPLGESQEKKENSNG